MSKRLIRRLAVMAALGTTAVVVGLLASAGSALAYGHADHPIAQVEISANCNNPSFWLCNEVGLGGVWAWAELDNPTGVASPTSGTMDYTLAFCGHTGPGGGPHSAGAFGHPGTGAWTKVMNPSEAISHGAFPFFDPSKAYDAFYVLDFQTGNGEDDFMAVVPAALGHYSSPADWPAGAQFQVQVAP